VHLLIVKFLVAHRFEDPGNGQPLGKAVVKGAARGDVGGFVLVAPRRETRIFWLDQNIDVFSETVDQPESLGQRCSALQLR
jgi:hypothetical protein